MFNALRKLRYAARVLLSRKGGEPETIDVAGRPTVLMSGGSGPPFVYLHSTLGEALPLAAVLSDAWAQDFTVYAPDASRLRQEAADSTRSTRSRTWRFTTSSCSTRWAWTR